jgi:alkylation response protein AidB-like acyl-CoA dehydrogenase
MILLIFNVFSSLKRKIKHVQDQPIYGVPPMTYRAPVRDLMFALENVVDFDQLVDSGAYPDLSSELVQAILEESGKFAAEKLAPLNVAGDETGATLENGQVRAAPGFKEAYSEFNELGFGTLPFDVSFGGQGLPGTLALALMEYWASANMSWGLCPILTEGSVKAIRAHGTREQMETYLPKLISGEWTGTMNLTESQAGSDVGALRARAEVQGDGSYLIRGTKIFISWGDHDMTENIVHLVLARTAGAPDGTKGISLFIVPKFLVNNDGTLGSRNDIKCLKLEEKLGLHASPTCVLEFGESEGAVGYLLGEENRGMACMFTMMNSARLNVGMEGVGIAERAFQRALAFSQERTQGQVAGKPPSDRGPVAIFEHADVRRTLLNMKSHVEAARAICLATAVASDLSEVGSTDEICKAAKAREEVLTPIAKAWSTDIGFEVASHGVQIHGGMGFIEETGAAQHMRDVRVTQIYEGTNGIQAADLANRKLALGGGTATDDLVREIEGFANELAGHENSNLKSIGAELQNSLTSLRGVIDWLRENSKDRTDNVMAGATPYLRLFGNVTGGYFLAKAALAAETKLAGDAGNREYLSSKIALATFFADNILCQSQGLATSVKSGADTLYGVSAEALSA